MNACNKYCLLGILSSVILFVSSTSKAEEIVMWKRNFDAPYLHASMSNILKLSEEKYGKINIVSSQAMEQGQAFQLTTNSGDIDIFIGGINLQRERLANVIYIPLDRGLLGFRLCLVHKDAPSVDALHSLSDLQKSSFSIGVGAHWPDKPIFQNRGFMTVSDTTYENLFAMLANKEFDCFSRSVAEITSEIESHTSFPIKVDDKLLFVYPYGQFIFTHKNNTALSERLAFGFQKALDNGSFLKIFNEHHDKILQKQNIYTRKMLILENDDLSDRAKQAINYHGIASFISH